MQKARAVSADRRDGRIAALEARFRNVGGSGPFRLDWTFRPLVRRGRDRDNVVHSCKALIDGVADAGGVDDVHFRHGEVVIEQPRRRPEVVLLVTEIGAG